MTRGKVLKQFFKKFFNIDAHGSSPTELISNIIEENDEIAISGSAEWSSMGYMVVNFTYDSTASAWKADQTFSAIKAAYDANTPIVGMIDGNPFVTAQVPSTVIVHYETGDVIYAFKFVFTPYGVDNADRSLNAEPALRVVVIKITANNEVTQTQTDYTFSSLFEPVLAH